MLVKFIIRVLSDLEPGHLKTQTNASFHRICSVDGALRTARALVLLPMNDARAVADATAAFLVWLAAAVTAARALL